MERPRLKRPKLESSEVANTPQVNQIELQRQLIMDPQVFDQTSSRPKRGQANRRERVRTENVNAGFDRLRKLIPTEPTNRKLSKIEILRLSTSYIKHLYNLTRANSCLDAETLDSRDAEGERQTERDSRPRGHVCTFCLMRTKSLAGRRN